MRYNEETGFSLSGRMINNITAIDQRNNIQLNELPSKQGEVSHIRGITPNFRNCTNTNRNFSLYEELVSSSHGF